MIIHNILDREINRQGYPIIKSKQDEFLTERFFI